MKRLILTAVLGTLGFLNAGLSTSRAVQQLPADDAAAQVNNAKPVQAPTAEQEAKIKMALPVLVAPKDGRFEVRMPGEAAVFRNEEETLKGMDVSQTFAYLTLSAEPSYAVWYTDFSGHNVWNTTASQKLDKYCDGFIASKEGRIVDKKAIKVDGYPAREVTAVVGNKTYAMRYIVTQDRGYMILIVQQTKNRDIEKVQQYFDSFKLVR